MPLSNRWKNTLTLFVKIGITTALMIWVFRGVDLHEAVNEIREAKIGYLILTLFFTWFGHYLCVIRWRFLLEMLSVPMRTGRLVLIYCIGMFSNLILPGLVGGDLVKIVLTGRDHDHHYSKALASVYLDRAVGLLALLVIALSFSMVSPWVIQGVNLFWAFLLLTLGFIFLNLLLFYPGAHRWVLLLSRKTGRNSIAFKTQKLVAAFTGIRHSPVKWGYTFVLSLINQFLVILSSFVIATALGIEAPFFDFAVFIPAISLITMIPISINGMGLREMATASFFLTIGVSKHQGIALGFLFSLLIIASSLPGAVAYLLHKNEVKTEQLEEAQWELSGEETNDSAEKDCHAGRS